LVRGLTFSDAVGDNAGAQPEGEKPLFSLGSFPSRLRAVLWFLGFATQLVPSLFAANQNQPATNDAAPPNPVFTISLETTTPPGTDLRSYLTAVSAVLRHSWPEKIKANLILPGDKGIVFVKTVILRNGALEQGSPALELSSGMSKLDDASLATVNSSTPFDPLPENFKGEKLETRIVFRYRYLPDAPFKAMYEAAQREVASQNYTNAAELLEALVAKDSDYTNAWNYLGWLYNKLGKYDKAADALKKAIVVNPRDTLAYNNLGQAYAYQKKYEEAVPQYLKQLEVNKNDRYASANLGRAYFELKQYDKAISVLETAATVDPKEPSVFYNLGRAYAKANQPEKAEEAFKKSVDLDPVPMRMNNVAYQMAIANLDLPAAQHYAESGLAALVLKMRDTSIERVGADDARMTSSISYLWGTLGWILFEEGKVPEAEKYIGSAWLVRSNGEIGYNLGRVYEAEGRKDDAIRLYELSLGTTQPFEEARQHLSQLLGSDSEIDQRVQQRRSQLTDMRTISIPNAHDADGVAEFWILLSPGPKVLGAKFITGDEVLRLFTKELESASFPGTFPEATEIRLLRRGRLACVRSAGTPCRLLLASSETVRTDE
jgi:tetratricopeptide (TPR) repeat protein